MSFKIIELETATTEDTENIGYLMPYLDDSYPVGPISLEKLRRTVESPSAAQFVGKLTVPKSKDTEGYVDISTLSQAFPYVGAATVSTLHGVIGETMGKAWLEDFVVVPDARKFKVAKGMWDAITDWRVDNNLGQMLFTSSISKERAHGFYTKNDCYPLAEGITTLWAHDLE